MNVLLSLLHSSPEYESLRAMLDAGQTAAVSGVSQIARTGSPRCTKIQAAPSSPSARTRWPPPASPPS